MKHNLYALFSSNMLSSHLSRISELASAKSLNSCSEPNLIFQKRTILLIFLEHENDDPIKMLDEIKTTLKDVIAIFVGGEQSQQILIELFRNGLNDYLIRPINQIDIDNSIDRITLQQKNTRFNPNDYKLKKREAQVCRLLTEGLISKEIAERLHISPATVKVHKSRLFAKLQIKTVPELMKIVLS